MELTPTEYALLRFLVRNGGRIVPKEQLLRHVWQYEHSAESTVVETYISYLRRKLEPLGPPVITDPAGRRIRARMSIWRVVIPPVRIRVPAATTGVHSLRGGAHARERGAARPRHHHGDRRQPDGHAALSARPGRRGADQDPRLAGQFAAHHAADRLAERAGVHTRPARTGDGASSPTPDSIFTAVDAERDRRHHRRLRADRLASSPWPPPWTTRAHSPTTPNRTTSPCRATAYRATGARLADGTYVLLATSTDGAAQRHREGAQARCGLRDTAVGAARRA